MSEQQPPIIIKRVKKQHGHGHHGGAWKVAYADFVTAMMALFMLLWLMGSTTPQQKTAIADFFEDPSAGTGASTSVIDLGGSAPEVRKTDAEKLQKPTPALDEQNIEDLAEQMEKERLESLMEELKQAIDSSQALKPFKDQLLLDITDEGLRIQIVDKENRPMFSAGSAILQGYTREILREIVKVVNEVPNKISLSGHTDETPFASQNGYSNWELSADRANAARRELVAAGVNQDKIARVVGLGSSALFDKANPYNPINRRISIIVMKKQAEEALAKGEGG